MRRLTSILLFALPAISSPAWTVVNLHPPGATSSKAYAGANGKQGGYAIFSGATTKPGIWSGTPATWVNLEPAGRNYGMVHGMSASHQVGTATISASRWTGTAASWLDLHPVGLPYSVATCVYNSQQGGYLSQNGRVYAAIWNGSPTGWVNLSVGYQQARVNAMSDNVQVGYIVFGQTHAAKWQGTEASLVDLHPASAQTSEALGTANNGVQVGYFTLSTNANSRAARWSNTVGSFQDIHPAGAESSVAYATNGTHHVGYQGDIDSIFRACLWTGSSSLVEDLHDALPADFADSVATAISTGPGGIEVIGYGYNETTGRYEALLWKQGAPNLDFALALNKSTVAGQNSVLATITMVQAQPSSTVFMTYDNSSLVLTPPTATVLANTTVKNFQLTTTAVNSTINTIIYAKLGSVIRSQPLMLAPLIPTALQFTPSQVTGGQSTSCRVVINGVAGPGGRVIAILDNSANANVPSTVTVPAGATSVTFNITTTAVTTIKTVTVTARVSAGEKTGTFRINP